MIPSIWNVQNKTLYLQRQKQSCWESQEGGLEVTARVSICADGHVLESETGDGSKHCKYIETHLIVTL